mgnify:CR=1 FL=1
MGTDATLVSVIISGFVSAIVAYLTVKFQNREKKRLFIEQTINEVLNISMEYPLLENDDFCAKWYLRDNCDIDRMRYENYCCRVFNLLERIWFFCGGNMEKINMIIYVEEWVLQHKIWWQMDIYNIYGYKYDFRVFINGLISKNGNDS